MTPFQTWKKNKGRVDLRQFTREFQKKFKIREKCQIEPGKVYAITYRTDNSFPTDKHHVTPVIFSLGKFRGDDGYVYVRGINLLYLDTRNTLEVLEDGYPFVGKSPMKRVVPVVSIHDKYMKFLPWAYKNYFELRILTSVEIPVEEWGMIPLLYKYLMGNFNAAGLNEDFQAENKIKKKKKFSPVKEKEKEKNKEEVDEETIEEDLIDTDFVEEGEDEQQIYKQ